MTGINNIFCLRDILSEILSIYSVSKKKDVYLISSIFEKRKKSGTVRPRGTRPHGTQTSLGHDFKKGSKFLAGHDFGT